MSWPGRTATRRTRCGCGWAWTCQRGVHLIRGFYFLEAPSERLEAPSQLEAPLEAPFRGRPGPPWSPDDGRSPRHEGRHPPPKDPPDPLFLLIYPWVTARAAPLPPLPAARGFVVRAAAFFDFLRSGGGFPVERMGKDGAAASLGYGTIRPHHVLTVCSLRPYGGADICDPQVRIAGSCPPASTTSPTSLLRAGAARRALPHRHRHRHLRRRHCHHHHHIAALSPCLPCHRR